MVGRICAVVSCRNNQLTLHKKGSKITFHYFPKGQDLVSSIIRKKWIHSCRRKDNKFNVNTSTICSHHFSPNDYERDLQHELLDLPLRKILKKTAVPTMKLGDENQADREEREQINRSTAILDHLNASTGTGSDPPSSKQDLNTIYLTSDVEIDAVSDHYRNK